MAGAGAFPWWQSPITARSKYFVKRNLYFFHAYSNDAMKTTLEEPEMLVNMYT